MDTGCENGTEAVDICRSLFNEMIEVSIQDGLNAEATRQDVELEGQVLIALSKHFCADPLEHIL